MNLKMLDWYEWQHAASLRCVYDGYYELDDDLSHLRHTIWELLSVMTLV